MEEGHKAERGRNGAWRGLTRKGRPGKGSSGLGEVGIGSGSTACTLFPLPGLKARHRASRTDLSSLIAQVRALAGLKTQVSPPPKETSSLLLTSVKHSVGPAGSWLGS